MQTFLPYYDFVRSAACLDNRRLGKQRVEAKQILETLKHGGGWEKHPAVKMWRGYERGLSTYGLVMCGEWRRRGYVDNLHGYFVDNLTIEGGQYPWWLGWSRFHASHRSNLLRKNPKHYEQFGWPEGPDLPYVWPEWFEKQEEGS